MADIDLNHDYRQPPPGGKKSTFIVLALLLVAFVFGHWLLGSWG